MGPESAGADPGPASYGTGELPTVTDANVVLGRIESLLGGEMPLDRPRAEAALSRLAADIARASGRPCAVDDAALGVVRVVSASMERALRVVSVERGYDPRNASLLSFGGAGGLHACALADSLGMRRVVVPPFPGAFSAVGLLAGDVVRDLSATMLGAARPIAEVFASLEADGLSQLAREGFGPGEVRIERFAAMRYRGQSYEIDIPWSDSAADSFHDAHRTRYGHADTSRPIEIVAARVRVSGLSRPLDLHCSENPELRQAAAASSTRVRFEDGWRDAEVFRREDLEPGAFFPGPALVVEYGSTTLVPEGWMTRIDEWRSMRIERPGGQ